MFSPSGQHFAENKKTTPALDGIHQPVVVIPFAMQNVNSQLLPNLAVQNSLRLATLSANNGDIRP